MAICAFLEHWNLLEKVFWRLETGAGIPRRPAAPRRGAASRFPQNVLPNRHFYPAHPGRMRRKKGGIPTALTQFQSTVPREDRPSPVKMSSVARISFQPTSHAGTEKRKRRGAVKGTVSIRALSRMRRNIRKSCAFALCCLTAGPQRCLYP